MTQKMMLLYGPESPTYMIDTQYGNISWASYLQKEADRIGKQPGRIAEIRDNCLFVNRLAGRSLHSDYVYGRA